MSRTFTLAGNIFLNRTQAPITTTPCTLECWFYFTGSNGNDNCLIQVQDSAVSDNYFRLGNSTSEEVMNLAHDGTFQEIVSTATFSGSAWHYGCSVFVSSTDRRAFLNGGNKGSGTTSITPSGLNSVDIGNEGDSTPGDNWIGRIANAVIRDVALSDAEVAFASQRGVSPFRIRPSSIKAFWPLFGNSDPEVDLSGNGYHLTLNNSPGVADHVPVGPPFGFNYHPSFVGGPTPSAAVGGSGNLISGGLIS